MEPLITSPEPVTMLQQRLEPAMDRRIEPKRRRLLPLSLALLSALVAIWLLLRFLDSTSVRSLSVSADRVTIATVRAGIFDDFIPVRGAVTPLRTVYLDAVEGGRVEKVLVEEGSLVEPGQPLVELSNTALQLDVISREAQVSEQLNNLRNTRLAMEQNRLALKSELVEIDYQIKRLSRLADRRERLAIERLIAREDLEETLDELAYYRQRRAVTLESQAQDERLRRSQIQSLESGVAQLERNLTIARRNLDSLVITAPLGGRLTALDAELGASKGRGERLGQIDDVDEFKVTAYVDEYYVTRLAPGQRARFDLAGREYQLEVEKVYPQVREGRFRVDLAFAGEQPRQVRRGQTLQLEIALGDPEQAVLVQSGGFYRDTGGNWAFVLDESGKFAHRRPIELGRRSPDQLEVLSGLVPGDRVITSDYTAFLEIDRIELAR